MSNFSASIPVANMAAANTTLESAGYGPDNFSVPAYSGPSPSVALLHAWGDPEFEAAVAAIPNVTITQGSDPVAMTAAAATAKGAKWGANAPQLPSSGNVTAGGLYQFDGLLWSVIQTFNRSTYGAHPSTYPALIRRVHTPGELQPWKQPTDQYDAYKLVNPFNGKPDQCTHKGFTWKVTQADGSGNNVWEPGVFGWGQIGPAPTITINMDDDEFPDVLVSSSGGMTITENADSFNFDVDIDGRSDFEIKKKKK